MIKLSMLVLVLFGIVHADKIEFNNRAVVNGKVTTQDATTVTIEVDGKKTTYAKSDIKSVILDTKIAPPPPPPAVVTPAPSKAVVPLKVAAGSTLHTISIAPLSTAQHKKGHQFKMQLESDLIAQDGRVIALKGADVYGVVVESQQAGRLLGKSSMLITLHTIVVKGHRIAVKTNAINALTAKKQGRDTAGKMVGAAAIGALIDGRDGARTGVKVGLGAAILTRGKATGIPAGRLLDFTFSADVIVK